MQETDLTEAHLLELGFQKRRDWSFTFSMPPASRSLFTGINLTIVEMVDGGYVVSLQNFDATGTDSRVVLSSLPERLTVERVKALLLVLMQPYMG